MSAERPTTGAAHGPDGMDSASLASAFPFGLAINDELEIVFSGKLLDRLCSGPPVGRRLGELFALTEPAGPPAFFTIRDRAGSQVTLQLRESGIRLRGPVVAGVRNDLLFILTAPWFMDVAKLQAYDLAFEEYTVQTPLEDLQGILRGRTLALDDARRLNEELYTQREELQRANEQLTEQGRKLEDYAAELRERALHDYLTNLPNRLMFMNTLHQVLQTSRGEEKYLFAVFFADLDRFKLVNDSLGHLMGDRLLVEVGQRILDCTRTGDVVARFGGDEFVILLDRLNGINEAIEVARQIQREVEVPFQIEAHEIYTSISIGITFSDRGYESPEDILRDADTALYRTKAERRTGYGIFNAAMHGEARGRLDLERDLRRALEQDQFAVYYQPILGTGGELHGFEALLRWFHPEQGEISPARFIPAAEDTGLITSLGGFALAESCRAARAWREQGFDIKVHVNISAVQFRHANFAEYVLGILEATGAQADCLGLELTESTLMENEINSHNTLRDLRKWGVGVALDDFGTGYSSLAYLRDFALDTLKIDRSFIKNLPADTEARKIARAIIALGHSLGLSITAEGVETEAQSELLVREGCDHLQGFLFSRAIPEAEATAFAESRQL